MVGNGIKYRKRKGRSNREEQEGVTEKKCKGKVAEKENGRERNKVSEKEVRRGRRKLVI